MKKLIPMKKMPNLIIPLINHGNWNLSERVPGNFTMVVFYRGLHCPICEAWLKSLQNKMEDFTQRGIDVIAISMDSQGRAKNTQSLWGLCDVPLGYDLSMKLAKKWGIFLSKGIQENNEPEVFSEPGIFLVNKDQTLYFSSIQTMQFIRPCFSEILSAIDYVVENKYPARGGYEFNGVKEG